MDTQRQDDPHSGEPSRQEPHIAERREAEGTGDDQDDMKKAGMRPTGSGGSAQPPPNR